MALHTIKHLIEYVHQDKVEQAPVLPRLCCFASLSICSRDSTGSAREHHADNCFSNRQ